MAVTTARRHDGSRWLVSIFYLNALGQRESLLDHRGKTVVFSGREQGQIDRAVRAMRLTDERNRQ